MGAVVASPGASRGLTQVVPSLFELGLVANDPPALSSLHAHWASRHLCVVTGTFEGTQRQHNTRAGLSGCTLLWSGVRAVVLRRAARSGSFYQSAYNQAARRGRCGEEELPASWGKNQRKKRQDQIGRRRIESRSTQPVCLLKLGSKKKVISAACDALAHEPVCCFLYFSRRAVELSLPSLGELPAYESKLQTCHEK